MIPNLAIHMNRTVNDGYKFNAAKGHAAAAGLRGVQGHVHGRSLPRAPA
jgi:aspartyl aminopeptidase